MLRLLHSDRIEDLGAALKARLAAERAASDPFAPVQVVVPNASLAGWLRLRVFADAPALSMGVAFPFVERRLHELMCESLPAGRRPRLLPMNAYANGILAILLRDGDDPDLAPFRRYIAGGDAGPLTLASRTQARMAWQLAVKLADLMDQYEVRRREIVHRWLDADAASAPRDPTERAEAALARKLFGLGGLYPPDGDRLSLRQLYERVEAACPVPTGRPQRVHVFGLSTLSAVQVGALHWLARTHEVTVYHHNVCLEYWGDIENERLDARIRRLRGGQREADFNADGFRDLACDSTLLRQWGVAGRETLRLLVDLEEANAASPHRVDFEWEEAAGGREPGAGGGTMLQRIQASVRRRTDEMARTAQDASVQVVAAPGIRREVETVYNAILGAVWKPDESGERPWRDGTFSDIAVLVTDMKTYRPVIEAVFGARGQIPYSLVDATAAEESRYLAGFLALMAVAREGLSRETVFAVLANPCVQAALGFTDGDVRDWRRVADGSGAYDGFAGAAGYANVSWAEAMRRVRLGRVANDGEGLAVWQGADDATALRLSEIVEALHRELAPLAARRQTTAAWAAELRRIADAFLAVGPDRPLEEGVRRQVFAALDAMGVVGGEQGLDLAVEAVAAFAGGLACRRGGYLTHGVTIAGLKPMRPVPFRQVFVLGMGEGGFPGRDGASTLDIRGARRTLGDATLTETNRYLFLETLMATRERLVLSYPCLDTAKDARLFPSGMVRELEDFITAAALPTGEAFREVEVPLLERGEAADEAVENPVGPIVWTNVYYAGLVPTYSAAARRLAQEEACQGRGTREKGLETRDQGRGVDAAASSPSPAELAAFLDAPLRAALRHRLGIAVEADRDTALEADAPVELPRSGLVRRRFDQALLEGTEEPQTIYARFAAHGLVPDERNVLGQCAEAGVGAQAADGTLAALRAFVAAHNGRGDRPQPPADGGEDVRLARGPCGEAKDWLPPRAVLAPLMAWLAEVAAQDDDAPRSLRVGVVDTARGAVAEWVWERVNPAAARDYLATVGEAYATYLSRPDADGRYLDIGYRQIAATLQGRAEGRLPTGRQAGDLVIARVMEGLRRDATTEEVRRLAASPLYALPLVGRRAVISGQVVNAAVEQTGRATGQRG